MRIIYRDEKLRVIIIRKKTCHTKKKENGRMLQRRNSKIQLGGQRENRKSVLISNTCCWFIPLSLPPLLLTLSGGGEGVEAGVRGTGGGGGGGGVSGGQALWASVTLSVGPRRRWLMCGDKQRARWRVLAGARDGRSDESSVYLRLDSNGDGRGWECWGVALVIPRHLQVPPPPPLSPSPSRPNPPSLSRLNPPSPTFLLIPILVILLLLLLLLLFLFFCLYCPSSSSSPSSYTF